MVIILLIIIFFLFRKSRANRLRTTGAPNKRAILLYSDIEKMLIFNRSLPAQALLEENEACIKEHSDDIAAEDFEQLMEIVRKARFGHGTISSQELERVIKYRNRLYGKLYSERSAIKKLYLILRLSL
jgi:uncharacterized membrane protein